MNDGLEVAPSQRQFITTTGEPFSQAEMDCEAACNWLRDLAFGGDHSACLDNCLQTARAQPTPIPFPALPKIGEVAGAGKWLVVGLVAVAVISVTRVFR